MSHQAFFAAWQMNLPPIEKLIMMKLSDSWVGYPDDEGGTLFTKYHDLAAFCGCTIDEVRHAITALVRRGRIRDFAWGYEGFVCTLEYRDEQLAQPPAILRPKLPAAVRREVMDRDGHCCVVCGSEGPLHIDHVHPVSRGGGDEVDNLQVLCARCNVSKGAKTMAEWRGEDEA